MISRSTAALSASPRNECQSTSSGERNGCMLVQLGGGDDDVHHLGFEARAARSAYRPRKLPNPPIINAAVPIPNNTCEKGNDIRLLTIPPALPS